ncbi:MAG TPA: MFS transporter [Streptosporangiaceae bacterium]|nr:MFS transporter [Streptosporangiaceae bacterium]
MAVALATFMTYLDNNVTNVAIPTIQRSLHLSIAGLEWVVSSYVLVFAGLLLVGGRLADSFGRRRLFYIGTVLFTVSSLAAGLAGSGGVLIAARLVQGLGAALLVPTTLAIIMATFTDARERTTAISAWTAIGAMALAFGPLIGGFISQHFHWGWIFYINVPVGIIAVVIAAVTMDESKDDNAAGRLDLPGMLTSSLALFSLTYALIEGHDKGWTSGLILGAFVLAAIASTAFVLIESRTEHPMVPLSLFRNRVYSGGTVTMMLWGFGIFGIYFFTSLYLQNILGFSPSKAGLAFVPMAICLALAATLAGPVYLRLGTNRTVAAGMLAMGGGLALMSTLGAGASFAALMPGFVIFGLGAGLMQVPLTNAILESQPEANAGIASALLNAAREVSGLLGITVIGAVLRATQSGALNHGTNPAGAFLDGYHAGLYVTVGLLVAGAVLSFVALRGVKATAPPVVPPSAEPEKELAGAAQH